MATLICWWGQRCIYAFFSKFVCFVLQNIAILEGFLSVFLSVEAVELRGASPPRPPPGALPLDPTRGPRTPDREQRELCSLRSLRFARGIFLKSVITPLLILQWLQKYVIAKAGETRGSRTALLFVLLVIIVVFKIVCNPSYQMS